MPSKYKAKLPKPVVKQMPPLKELSMMVASRSRATCTNCGSKHAVANMTHSKCRCGGTFQTYSGVTNGLSYSRHGNSLA